MDPLMAQMHRDIGGIFLISGGETFVGIGHAPAAVGWLREHGCTILGFDGFNTDGRHLFPLMEYIADLSDLLGAEDAPNGSASEAMRILAEWKAGPSFVTFVVEQPAV